MGTWKTRVVTFTKPASRIMSARREAALKFFTPTAASPSVT